MSFFAADFGAALIFLYIFEVKCEYAANCSSISQMKPAIHRQRSLFRKTEKTLVQTPSRILEKTKGRLNSASDEGPLAKEQISNHCNTGQKAHKTTIKAPKKNRKKNSKTSRTQNKKQRRARGPSAKRKIIKKKSQGTTPQISLKRLLHNFRPQRQPPKRSWSGT